MVHVDIAALRSIEREKDERWPNTTARWPLVVAGVTSRMASPSIARCRCCTTIATPVSRT